MSTNTAIQWTDYTWSPWLGCRKVSPGCENCYITTTTPFRTRHIKHGAQREELSEAYWKQPLRWNNQPLLLTESREHRKARVFPSLCDPFDQEVPLEWKIEFWKLVWKTSNLTWLILTKRIEHFHTDWTAMKNADVLAYNTELPPNVWLGVSVEDQKRADERIPILLSIPAKVRFLSVEPMLEAIDLTFALPWTPEHEARKVSSPILKSQIMRKTRIPGVNWVIFGGESGAKARPCSIDWIRDGQRQCRDAGVACFVKQLGFYVVDRNDAGFEGDDPGEWPMDTQTKELDPMVYQGAPVRVILRDTKGGDPSEWPTDLRVREFPNP